MHLESLTMAYEINYDLYLKGYITDEEWSEYCIKTLKKLIEMNKDVLDRLKNV